MLKNRLSKYLKIP